MRSAAVRNVLEIRHSKHTAPHNAQLRIIGLCGTPHKTEFGATWKKTARDTDREYLSVKLDDPSFPAPIYASLVKVEGDEGFTLISATATDRSGSSAPPLRRRGFLRVRPAWALTWRWKSSRELVTVNEANRRASGREDGVKEAGTKLRADDQEPDRRQSRAGRAGT